GTTNALLRLVSSWNSDDRSMATQSVSVCCSATEIPLSSRLRFGGYPTHPSFRRKVTGRAASATTGPWPPRGGDRPLAAGGGARVLLQHPLVRDRTRGHRAVHAHVDQAAPGCR